MICVITHETDTTAQLEHLALNLCNSDHSVPATVRAATDWVPHDKPLTSLMRYYKSDDGRVFVRGAQTTPSGEIKPYRLMLDAADWEGLR